MCILTQWDLRPVAALRLHSIMRSLLPIEKYTGWWGEQAPLVVGSGAKTWGSGEGNGLIFLHRYLDFHQTIRVGGYLA